MIGRLEGRIHQIDPGRVLIDVGGVGYLVSTTLRAIHELGASERAALLIHTQVRDDAIELYGFSGRDELASVVSTGDVARLTMTPGVGKKTAQRILLELKGRLSATATTGGDLRGDAASALVNLGYRQAQAMQAVEAVMAENTGDDVGEVLRLALRYLTK